MAEANPFLAMLGCGNDILLNFGLNSNISKMNSGIVGNKWFVAISPPPPPLHATEAPLHNDKTNKQQS